MLNLRCFLKCLPALYYIISLKIWFQHTTWELSIAHVACHSHPKNTCRNRSVYVSEACIVNCGDLLWLRCFATLSKFCLHAVWPANDSNSEQFWILETVPEWYWWQYHQNWQRPLVHRSMSVCGVLTWGSREGILRKLISKMLSLFKCYHTGDQVSTFEFWKIASIQGIMGHLNQALSWNKHFICYEINVKFKGQCKNPAIFKDRQLFLASFVDFLKFCSAITGLSNPNIRRFHKWVEKLTVSVSRLYHIHVLIGSDFATALLEIELKFMMVHRTIQSKTREQQAHGFSYSANTTYCWKCLHILFTHDFSCIYSTFFHINIMKIHF